jgi:hypothetical protein
MPGLYTGATGLWGGFAGLLYGSTSLSTPPGLLADAAGFSPASLFAAGEQGVWYDPSDFSTMFQDAAGTTPVTAVEQPVGLLLDKSQGLVLGPELVSPINFTSGWTSSGTTVTFNSASTYTAAGVANVFQEFFAVGKWYKLTINATFTSAGVMIYNATSAVNLINSTTIVSGNSYTYYFLAAATQLNIRPTSAGTVTVNSISVKLLPGNHATQSTTAARPVLSARVNLLTYSEQFDNAIWTAVNTKNVTPNTDVAPDGTITADTITDNSAVQYQGVQQTGISVVSGVEYTFSLYIKKTTGVLTSYPSTHLGKNNIDNSYSAVMIDTTNGTLADLTGGVYTAPSAKSIISVGNYWLVSITTAMSTSTTRVQFYPSISINGSTLTASAIGSSVIWGADLRPANQTTLLPAYQRIAAATDYDTTGFPYYLRFDGTDDSMATGTINFSATDKMSVFAGVRKLAVSFGSFATLGALNAAGQFDMAGVTSAGVGYYASSLRGNSGTEAGTRVAPYLDPITNVVQTSFDIAGATRTNEISIRVNGIVPANQSENPGAPGPAGGGNFGNYPLYIGSRGGSSLRFNGNIYSLIVLGRTATAAEITNTETYVNSKTLAY